MARSYAELLTCEYFDDALVEQRVTLRNLKRVAKEVATP